MYLTLMHKLGLIYDLREPSANLVRKTIINHGAFDESHFYFPYDIYIPIAFFTLAGDGTHPVHGKQAHEHQSVGYPGEPNTGY